MPEGSDYPQLAAKLATSLDLRQPPVAICFTDSIPAGLSAHAGPVPAGCRFWQDAASATFATSASDHSLCAIGVYTHNLQPSPAQQTDLMDALKVFGELTYVREQDIASIPVLRRNPDMSSTPLWPIPPCRQMSSSCSSMPSKPLFSLKRRSRWKIRIHQPWEGRHAPRYLRS